MNSAEIETQAAGGAALLIIDMINDLDFEGADDMLPEVEATTDAVLGLRAAADAAGVPVVYVNDNFGQWHSERTRLLDLIAEKGGPGRELVRRLAPRDDDYFVIKPQFSGFYSTNLPVLLPKLGANRLVLTGIAADMCVLFTAADAHMRDYSLWVPEDAVACSSPDRKAWALGLMAHSMNAEVIPSRDKSLRDWLEDGRAATPRWAGREH